MSTGEISEILCIENSLLNFQNGTLISNKIDEFRCSLYNDQEEHLFAAVASDKRVYSGKVSTDDDLYNNFLLKQNKKTGKCQLITYNKVLLNMVGESKRKVEAEESTWQKKVSDLNKYFGSKKIKMVTEQNERLKVDVENIKTTLEQTAKDTHVDESDVVPFKADENDSLYRPPINREASKIEDIYPLNSLIPSDVLQELDDKAKELLDSDDQLQFCDFVKTEFIKLQKQSASLERHNKAKLLLYIDCLINLLKQPAKNISHKKFSACSFSSHVSTYILDNFTLKSATGRTRPLSMRDKCICYVLVLSTLALDNILNLDLLTKDLKVGAKKLQDVSKILAFTNKGSNKNIITLTLPLPSPVSGASRKKRK